MTKLSTRPLIAPDLTESTQDATDRGWVVIVHDNDTNTDVEVMAILMVATGCDEQEAFIETWEVDALGQSTVHIAAKQECERAAEIIRTIGIKVTVEPNL
ncbi:MAG: ATP-dependent Clp protease adaptor ClpS [Chthonomonas sp.]|nr:ATP-dependent Clp protease adaptor ClpS [Chthonomonas sp.]